MRTRTKFLHFLLGVALAVFATLPVQAFHFPWDQGHDTFQPNPPDDSQEPECPDEDNRCETSNPVDIGAGDKIQRSVDFSFPGFGPQLALIRAYHSQDLSDGPFGFGWHTNLTTRLILVTDGETNTAIVVQGNGKRRRFTQQTDGSWASAPGSYQTLTVEADGNAALRDKFGTTQFFNRVGRLTSIKDRNNNTLTIGYDDAGVIASATAASGRTLTFTKGADGRIASVADPLGRSVQYYYDVNGYMIRAVDSIGGETLYGYHADSNLHTVTDPRGNTAITLTYDDQDRVTQEVLADGATYRFEYLSDTQTRVINPRGYQTLYTFNATGQPLEIRDPLGRISRSTWDANYNRLSHTDGNGHTTTYTYDDNGNLLTETDALDQVTTHTYEPTYNQVVSESDPDGNITRFEYDTQGNLTKIIDAQTNETVLTYDAQGRPVSTTDSRGNTTTYGYDAAGNLRTITDALGNTLTITYDVVGNLTGTTDAEGRTTTIEYDALNRRAKITDTAGGESIFAYDANGNTTSVTNPRGPTTTYAYDTRNRQISMTNALAQTEIRAYDANDNLTSVTDVAGNATTYGYDAADQLTTETRPGSAVYQYEYDNVGNRTAVIDPNGIRADQAYDSLDRSIALGASNGDIEAYSYDRLGNQTSIQRKNGAGQLYYSEILTYDVLSRAVKTVAGMGQTTALGYDGNGNLTTITDPLGRTTVRAYDALNRISRLTDAASGITQYAYDRVGNLTSVSDAEGLDTEYSYDALNRLTQLGSPDTGTTAAGYDANGNLTQQTDSRGVTVTHAYDAIDRRTSTTFPILGEDRTYLYDQNTNGSGRLTGYDDESGSTRLTYDARGNVITETRTIQTQTYNLGYAYDTADRLISLTYPGGLAVTYSYDGQGRVQQINANGQPVLSDIAYLPFGPPILWTDGSGLLHTETYDTDYRSTGITVGLLQNFGYLYDDVDNITSWNDALEAGNSQSFGYDVLDRLTDGDGPYGAVDFTYDAVGNRTSKTVSTQITNYSYPADSHRLQETTGADPGTYNYDAAGNLIQDDRFQYVYNQANRLAEVIQSGFTVATYTYNAEGQREAKSAGAESHHFVYGPEGELLGVYDAATGAPFEEFVYFNRVPVATIRNGNTFYIHTDHLHTPRMVSDQTQTLVWRWISDPFGEAIPNQDPDGDGSLFVLNLRFPGQYFDAETGRNYNYFRDYDSTLGRYVQSDPLGIGPAPSTYGYANANPIRYADPQGLWAGVDDVVTGPVDEIIVIGGLAIASYLGCHAATDALDSLMSILNENANEQESAKEDADARQREYEEYKKRCNESPPPGLDPCETAKWKLQRNKDCLDMRQAWDDKWQPGRHQNDIDNLRRGIDKLEKWVQRNCS